MLPSAGRTAKSGSDPAIPECLEGPLALGAEWAASQVIFVLPIPGCRAYRLAILTRRSV